MQQGDVIEVTATAHDSTSSTTFSMVHHFRVTAHSGDIAAWLGKVATAYVAALNKTPTTPGRRNLLSMYPTTTSFQRLTAFNLDTPTESASQAITGQGTDAAQAYNPRAAALLSLVTGVRGRSYRGRLYYPPFSEVTVASGGTIDSTVVPVWTAFGEDIKVLGDAGDNGNLVVYSRKLSTTGIVFNTVVTSVLARSQLASQRRRRRILS